MDSGRVDLSPRSPQLLFRVVIVSGCVYPARVVLTPPPKCLYFANGPGGFHSKVPGYFRTSEFVSGMVDLTGPRLGPDGTTSTFTRVPDTTPTPHPRTVGGPSDRPTRLRFI